MDAQSGAGDRLILSAGATAVERELIRRWAADTHESPDRPIVDLRGGALAEALEKLDGGDPLLVPVGISWLPKERDGRREAGWLDLLRLRDPRRPDRFSQHLYAGRNADRYRVVVGEPARFS